MQEKNTVIHRLTMRDIDSVFKDIEFPAEDDGLISKLVIHKVNLKVKPATIANGVTTRLLFLMRDLANRSQWNVYGYAKARYNNLTELNIKEGASLGYSYYDSIQERRNDLSRGILDMTYIQNILKRSKVSCPVPCRRSLASSPSSAIGGSFPGHGGIPLGVRTTLNICP